MQPRCRHCYIDASTAMPGELSTDEALRVLGEIAEVNRETMLILSGGEPLLRSDLDALVSRAAVLGMMVVLGTNGTLLTVDRARALAERGLAGVGISLDSLAARRHDEFRGVKGAWRAAIRGIAAARQAGLEVQIQMTLTRANCAELPLVFLHWQLEERRTMFAALERGKVPRLFSAHLPVVSTLGSGPFPVHSATKGAGLTARDEDIAWPLDAGPSSRRHESRGCQPKPSWHRGRASEPRKHRAGHRRRFSGA